MSNEYTRKKLIFYGAGCIGREMAIRLVCEKVQIECFCDSDIKKCERNYVGYPVKSIDSIKGSYPEGGYHILITMIRKTAESVKEELIGKKIFKKSDFYDEEMDPLGVMKYFAPSTSTISIPQELERNFRYLNKENENIVKRGLLLHYFHVNSYDDLLFDYVRYDFARHLYDILEEDRKKIIPWLNSIHKLKGADILEIGCGTGASTVSLCEQEAKITAIDVSEGAMEAAKIRINAYGLGGR